MYDLSLSYCESRYQDAQWVDMAPLLTVRTLPLPRLIPQYGGVFPSIPYLLWLLSTLTPTPCSVLATSPLYPMQYDNFLVTDYWVNKASSLILFYGSFPTKYVSKMWMCIAAHCPPTSVVQHQTLRYFLKCFWCNNLLQISLLLLLCEGHELSLWSTCSHGSDVRNSLPPSVWNTDSRSAFRIALKSQLFNSLTPALASRLQL